MMTIRGLVWDDEPEPYMIPLKNQIAKVGIDLKICTEEHDFLDAFHGAHWDFAILDVFDRSNRRDTGLSLAKNVEARTRRNPQFPIFLLTEHPEDMTQALFDKMPTTAVLRSKGDLYWNIQYILEELKRRGVVVNRSDVFVIHSAADPEKKTTFLAPLREYLEGRGLKMVSVDSGNILTEILHGLVFKMNECGAILAVCTADDGLRDGAFQPRQNVLFEMGVALGLGRGPERLIILQQSGQRIDQRAVLPSDLGGLLAIRFGNRMEEAFEELGRKLASLGLES